MPGLWGHLYRLVGEQAAQTEDLALQRLIHNGAIKTREDADAYMAEDYNKSFKKTASDLGIKETNAEIVEGFNSNISRRRLAIYETLDQHQSKELQDTSKILVRSQFNQITEDPTVVGNAKYAPALMGLVDKHVREGTIPTSADQSEVLIMLMTDIAAKPDSAALLVAFGDQQFNMNGIQVKVKDLMSTDQYDNLILASETNSLAKRQDRQTQFTERLSRIDSIASGGDIPTARAGLTTLRAGGLSCNHPTKQLK